jgi:xylulokinase
MTARRPVLLGVDLGTTRVKVGLVSLEGELVAMARADQATDVDPGTGRAEQDAEHWWSGLRAALREATARAAAGGAGTEVVGIAIAGHGPTATPVDADGRPTGPAITWRDTRIVAERAEMERETGLQGWALGVLPAALWLERSGRLAGTRWVLNSWEALTLRLTGEAATTLVPDQRFPNAPALAAGGLDPRRIAPACPTGSIVGRVTAGAAADLGLAAGTPVIAGLVDAFASFHGAGMLDPGDAIDVGGAAGGFGVYWDRPVHAAGGFTTPAPLRGRWSVGGAMAATGSALDWLAGDVLRGGVSADVLIGEAAGIAPGADGLVFLPYLAGERSPIWDPDARGVLAGLTLAHGRAHVARAVLEAAAFAIRHVAEPMLDAGVRVGAMRVCGGPAHSETWNRIKADITGFEVAVPRVLETTVLGAAIVAAVGVGVHEDVAAAIRAMTSIERAIEPDPSTRAAYDRAYAAYRDLYPAVAPLLRAGASRPGTPAGVAA